MGLRLPDDRAGNRDAVTLRHVSLDCRWISVVSLAFPPFWQSIARAKLL